MWGVSTSVRENRCGGTLLSGFLRVGILADASGTHDPADNCGHENRKRCIVRINRWMSCLPNLGGICGEMCPRRKKLAKAILSCCALCAGGSCL